MKLLSFLFYIFCVFLGNIFTSPTFFTEKCDEYKRLVPNSTEFPHIAALAFPSEGKYRFQCGASLISKKHVIFPAHCATSPGRIRPKFARMGTIEAPIVVEALNPSTDYLLKKITIHPNYNVRKRSNNIALAELEKEVTFTGTVRPACLYTNYSIGVKTELVLTEWAENSDDSLILRKSKVSYVPTEECLMQHTVKLHRSSVTDGHMCASSMNDTCESQFGGPLHIFNGDIYTLVAVQSHGALCGRAVPSVYTSVYHYLDWIKSVAWN